MCLLPLDRVVIEACGSFAAVLRVPSHACPMGRSEQLRQLAAQLASLTTLEDAVAHGVQALLEVPPFALSLPSPMVAPNRPRGSVLLSQRGPTGL